MRAIFCCLFAAVFSATALADPAAAPTLADRAKARIELAGKLVADAEARYQRGVGTLADYVEAIRLRFVAVRESPSGKADQVKAAEQYRDALAKTDTLAHKRFDMGAVSSSDVLLADYKLAEAEFWLEEARARK
jgi:outer membrane protein TolC